jgi:3'-5' exoribonuclease
MRRRLASRVPYILDKVTPLRRNEPIHAWQAGDQVEGFALLTKKELRQDKRGMDFLDLELRDATGWIAGKVWSASPALRGAFEVHEFVAFRGRVDNFNEQLQLNVEQCREAVDDDRRFGFDESKLIPSSPYDLDELWGRLEAVYPGALVRPVLQRLCAETLDAHRVALREHPAAKSMHHAYRGGLLEHVVSMAELARMICAHYPQLDADLVLVGVLFHDLGKLIELGAMPRNDYTLAGRLVGHVVLGRDLLRERCAAIPDFPGDLQLQIEHLVLSHQGQMDYGSPVEPATAEAVALHFIDDLDSKLHQLRSAAEQGPDVVYSRGLGRYIYVGHRPQRSLDAPPEAGPPAETAPQEAEPAPPLLPFEALSGD